MKCERRDVCQRGGGEEGEGGLGRERGWEDGRGGERERDGDVLGVNLHYSYTVQCTLYMINLVHVHV